MGMLGSTGIGVTYVLTAAADIQLFAASTNKNYLSSMLWCNIQHLLAYIGRLHRTCFSNAPLAFMLAMRFSSIYMKLWKKA